MRHDVWDSMHCNDTHNSHPGLHVGSGSPKTGGSSRDSTGSLFNSPARVQPIGEVQPESPVTRPKVQIDRPLEENYTPRRCRFETHQVTPRPQTRAMYKFCSLRALSQTQGRITSEGGKELQLDFFWSKKRTDQANLVSDSVNTRTQDAPTQRTHPYFWLEKLVLWLKTPTFEVDFRCKKCVIYADKVILKQNITSLDGIDSGFWWFVNLRCWMVNSAWLQEKRVGHSPPHSSRVSVKAK